jgi:DNA polymerase
MLQDRQIRTGKMIRKRVRSRGMFEDGAPEGQWTMVEEEEVYIKKTFTYMGRNHRNQQWERLDGHGGIISQNVTEGICRDILMVGIKRLHELKFRIVGHSHDEIICLTKEGDNYHTLARMNEEMTAPIEWAPGFPLRAAGWVGSFYRKA